MQPGDIIKLNYGKEELQGVLMPSTDEKYVVLKLKNGYNLAMKKSAVTNETVIGKQTQGTVVPTQQQPSGLPKVSILHTGGTIASKVDYATGGVTPRFNPDELIDLFPELKTIAHITSRLILNVWSQDLRFEHYNLIAEEIQKEIRNGAQGVVVTHGTDTLHYTAAALSFMFEQLDVPIVLVGSQRSSDRGSSDAGMNLLNAVFFAAQHPFADVVVCMHHTSNDDVCTILPGTKCRKMHTSRRDAFKAINAEPLALVDYTQKKITLLQNPVRKKGLLVKPFKAVKVGTIRQHTNMFAEEFLFYKNYDGLVIEATGLGNLPVSAFDDVTKEHVAILDALKKLAKKMPVVLSPQTIYGRLNLNVYENARRQQEAGVLGNGNDMTTETTFIKLAWLLSNYTKDEAKTLILQNLRGELADSIVYEEQYTNGQ